MWIDILTIFPEMFSGPFSSSIIQRAQGSGALHVACHNIRDYATDKHRCVDDLPYGGGAGMVMCPEPLAAAIEAVPARGAPRQRILLTPQGRPLRQQLVLELATVQHLVLVCGRYEGVDERIREGWIDQEISIGDYVVSGGEIPAMVLVDAITRQLPGVLGNPESLAEESHAGAGFLEYPQYTRPEVFRGRAVPPVLLSGHHAAIAAWRREEALQRTLDRRPDLIDKAALHRQSEKKE